MPTQVLAIVRNGQIEPLEQIELPEGTQLVVTLNLRSGLDEDSQGYTMSLQGLNRAYCEDEPEYELSQIRELNPNYEGR